MKKLFATAVISAVLLATGVAFGQSASHDVEVLIPNVLMLRITDGTSNDATSDPSVTFDFQAPGNVDTYLDAVNDGGGNLAPTDVSAFGGVVVFSNRATWNVTVGASILDFVDSLGLSVTGNGVALSDISVTPSGTPGLNVSDVSTNWDLTTSTSIANGVRTQGWRSLGFSGGDYRLAVNGDENPGTYTTTVTYTIAAP
jgi:hypothetical protein